MSAPLSLHLPPELIEEIARRAADLLAHQVAPIPDYLTPGEAADYLRCSKRRIYDLTSAGRLRVCKDGSRNLYRRVDLDAYLVGGDPA
jgi:excisionase family DNA binding protein